MARACLRPGLCAAELHRRRADGQRAAGKPEPVTLVATGPQTNVALLLASHPELHAKIAPHRMIMGAPWGWATGSLRQSLIFTLIRRPRKWSFSRDPGGDGGP